MNTAIMTHVMTALMIDETPVSGYDCKPQKFCVKAKLEVISLGTAAQLGHALWLRCHRPHGINFLINVVAVQGKSDDFLCDVILRLRPEVQKMRGQDVLSCSASQFCAEVIMEEN